MVLATLVPALCHPLVAGAVMATEGGGLPPVQETPAHDEEPPSHDLKSLQNVKQTLSSTQQTVRELMRLENLQALEEHRARQSTRRPAMSLSVKAGDSASVHGLQLHGIYGVGNRMYAEVRSGSQVWRFKKGRAAPVGYPDDRIEAIRLVDVSGTCVHLMRQEKPEVLCLTGELP